MSLSPEGGPSPDILARAAAVLAQDPTPRSALGWRRGRRRVAIVGVVVLAAAATVVLLMNRTADDVSSGPGSSVAAGATAGGPAPAAATTLPVAVVSTLSTTVVAAESTPPTPVAPSTSGAPSTTAVAASTTAPAEPPTTTATVETTVIGAVVPAELPAPPNSAAGGIAPFTFEMEADGKAHMRGVLPTQKMADDIFASGAAVLGAENIVTEYTVVPGADLVFTEDVWHKHIKKTLYFPSGVAALQPGHDADLDVVVGLLLSRPDLDVHIQAYTDAFGTDDQNLSLSTSRSQRVYEYLVGHGVSPERVTATVGNGEAGPIGDNATEAGRALNRRVAVHLTVRA